MHAADHEAAEAALSLEQLSMDSTSESSQPDRSPLPPKMYL